MFGIHGDGGGSARPVRTQEAPLPPRPDVFGFSRGLCGTMDLPETIRKRLEDFSRNVLFDQSRTQTLTKENDAFLPHGKLKNTANVMN